MTGFKVSVRLSNYIGAPYWSELEKLTSIKKESGLSRARTAETRRKALDSYLASIGMTLTDYEELERLSARPSHMHDGYFYMHDGYIIVPELHVISTVVAACDKIGSRARPCAPDLARTVIRASPWYTGKTRPDGKWERLAVVSPGTGAKLSSRQALRTDYYIEDADAHGTFDIDTSVVRPEILWKALEWAGMCNGIGSARNGMGDGSLLRLCEGVANANELGGNEMSGDRRTIISDALHEAKTIVDDALPWAPNMMMDDLTALRQTALTLVFNRLLEAG